MFSEIHEKYYPVLRDKLSDRRLRHSECVAESAVRLSRMYGGDEIKMYTAGLLHDVMKEAGREETEAFCAKYGVEFSVYEKAAPKLWHAVTGSVYVRSVLGIEDDEIVVPIRYHTTGRAGMSLPEKIIFIADFISDDRDYPDVDVIRAKADESLESAMLYGLAYTIRELCEDEKAIHPDTVAAYNSLLLEQ